MTYSAIKPKSQRRLHPKPRLSVDAHVLRYLRNHPQGLTADQMQGWLKSRKEQYSLAEIDAALYTLRDRGIAAVTNGLWWLRSVPAPWIPPIAESGE